MQYPSALLGAASQQYSPFQQFSPNQSLTPYAPMDPIRPISMNLPNYIPAEEGSKGWFGIEGLGKNLDTLRTGLGFLQGMGSLWNASQQNKLAKRSFEYNKGLLDTNLANQISSYNLSLDDKVRSRAVVEGQTPQQAQDHYDRFKAVDKRGG